MLSRKRYFTMFWPGQNRWQGADFEVAIAKEA
jgi:hypothetical protein